ncbi:cytochrome ubiquinol oxidase subunit I [bacterium endosymbiont of Pedicinus badii]|uniref:cytochrome ubiquinol oxidase subunit I n=1 Tax=bacterium endosymbiont of Pedicinus badii TaxID=1719126 RepID=UPI0009B9F5F2|nr:cytochrome ubiquinol oxidase subunit I [bacterium endosymbiont of Pedicinus badii]OQM34320.1 cytochrome d terminal oxidase subunit 1 [bacterium endosymbiont of Pedicinus badii]
MEILNTVDLSRIQFALTAMYHFLFVPLTIGMSLILAIMETIYVIRGNILYRDMTQFWGKLFAINFAMGVATGIIMEFQFGTNWSYFSNYVGDIFGAPLAIEGLMAFFLESTFIGLFLFGWKKLGKLQHLFVTWMVTLGSNFSALWIIIANSWMQNPISYNFNHNAMRMEMLDISKVIFNPYAQVKFLHTVSSGYCTAAIFILSISSYLLVKKKCVNFAKNSFSVSAIFGFFAIIFAIFLGDESGFEINKLQKSKLSAIEAEWKTEKPPSSLKVFAIPNQKEQKNYYSIEIPKLLGIIATRSTKEKILGIQDIIENNKVKIRKGIVAYKILKKIKEKQKISEFEEKRFTNLKKYLGYALLLKKYTKNIEQAKDTDIEMAANDTIPNVLPLFFSFRIMVLCGFYMLFLFTFCLAICIKRKIENAKFLQKVCIFSLPIPWIASESGWFVSEYGRQPWIIFEILPTFLGISNVKKYEVLTTLVLFSLLYFISFFAVLYVVCKIIKNSPKFFEKNKKI